MKNKQNLQSEKSACTQLPSQAKPSKKTTAQILTAFVLALAIPHQLAIAAEDPVPLGSAGTFGVLAGSTITSTGNTVINDDLGLWPGSAVTGFPPGTVNGTTHITDPVAAAAQADLAIAFNDAAGRTNSPIVLTPEIGGQTLFPGLYRATNTLAISLGDLTLDAQGDPNAVFIFQVGTSLATTSGRQVILIGEATPANVFWQVGSSAVIGTASQMKGIIMADQSITIQTGATLEGAALARIGAVTLEANGINLSGPGGGVDLGNASSNVFVTAVSSIILNPQTGLFEQTVSLSNTGSETVSAFRLLIQALPVDVQVYNAGGSTTGVPYVQYNLPLDPDASVDLVIEYYRATRAAIEQPTFLVQDAMAYSVPVSGSSFAIDRSMMLESGRFLLEFSAVKSSRYAVQYSSDMTNWITADPIITAPANRVQWYDDGPPKTESRPIDAESRFYRVLKLP